MSLTYDAIGNPLSYYNGTSYTMTWAKGRQLASVSMGDETTGTTAISYAYDMDGIRCSKTVGGVTTEFVTQSGLVARQSWSGNTIDFFYDAQQRPYAMIYKPAGGTSVTDYYLTNLQGDVIALLDESGSVVAEYEYGAWGDIRSITDSSGAQVTSSAHIASINPLRYRGYYYDTETGFYYLQSRYYDPVIKRFINADAAKYSAMSALSLYDTNLFAYCRNNPVMYKDDDGDSVSVAVFVACALAGALVSGMSYVATHQDSFNAWSFVINVAGGAASGAVAVVNPSLAASITIGASLLASLCEGESPDVALGTALLSGALGYVTGPYCGRLTDAIIRSAGDFGANFLVSAVSGLKFEFVSQTIQSLFNSDSSIERKQTVTGAGRAKRKGIKGTDYWMRYYA